MRVDVAVRERNHTGPVVARAVHRHAFDLGEALDRGRRERLLVLGDPLRADALEVGDGRRESDRSFHIRGAGLELVRNLVVGRMIVPHAGDHLAAAVVGRHGVEQLRLRHQRPRAHGPEHLVPREGVEVAIERLQVDLQVRRRLRPVDDDHRAHRMRQPGELRGGIHGAERVRDVRERHDLGSPLERAPVVGEVDAPVPGDLHHPQRRALLLTQHLPRHEVRVVVHGRHHHAVAGAHVGAAVGAGHEVDRLRGAAREHHALRRPGVDESRQPGARRLVRFRGANREVVGPAMHVGVGGPVVLGDGVEHGLRLLGRRRVVEIDERVTVLPLRQQREIGPEAGGVEHHPSRSRTSRSSRSRIAGCRMRSRISAPNPYVRMPRAASGDNPRLRR